MSEFLAEAQVLIRPDTSSFRAELAAQLAAIKAPPVVVPVLASGAGLSATTAATGALSAAQGVAAASTANLTRYAEIANTSWAKQAVLLEAVTRAQLEQAGAARVASKSAATSTAALLGAGTATAKLDAALLGLRTAAGSAAVIGLGATALAAIAAGKAIRTSLIDFAAFEQELNTFRAVAEASADEMKAVRERAIQLGADVRLPGVSAADAAIAMTELAKAGLTVEETFAGVEGVLQLATAAQISNAEAAQIAANALNSFGLAGDQATEVADVLANAANAAQGSIADMGLALRQASAVAKQVGLSLQDTTSLLSLFAKNGLQGSDAGTALRTALIRLIAPTTRAREEIEKLDLKIRDAQGNLRADIFAQFGEATRSLSPAVRDASAALIFGQDAIRAVSIGAREGTDGLRLMQFQIDQTGTAAEVAAARTEGLGGAFQALKSTLQTVGIQAGAMTAGPLQSLLESLEEGAGAAGGLLEALQRLGRVRIPPITIPIVFTQIETPGGEVGDLVQRAVGEVSKTIAQGGVVPRVAIAGLQELRDSSDQTRERLRALNTELQGLQKARIEAERGGARGVADALTARIESIREAINKLKVDAGKLPVLVGPLQKAISELEKARDLRISINPQADTSDLDRLIERLENARTQATITHDTAGTLALQLEQTGNSARNAAGGVDALTAALAALTRQSSATQDELLRLQTEGGTPQQQIAVLQEDIAIQRRRIANLKKGGIVSGEPTLIRKAREQIKADQAEIESLQAGIASDAREAANKAKQAADDAQDARDKQFEALADLFGGRQERIETAIERAGITGNVQKQINLTKALIASLKKERAALLERLRTLKVSNAVRKKIMEAIDAAIEDAKTDLLRFQQQQQEKLQDALMTRFDLRIRIAQARDNIAAEIRARKDRLAEITRQLVRLKNAGKKNTLAWLELKAQQAEEIAAIKELEGQTEEKNNAFAQLAFQFMQAQQGFAANLISNLIPEGVLPGLTGGAAPAPQQQVAQASAIALSRDSTTTQGQTSLMIEILRQMLGELRSIRSGKSHPEAAQQKASGGTALEMM